jgi:hypothetical protein
LVALILVDRSAFLARSTFPFLRHGNLPEHGNYRSGEEI